MPEDLYEPYFHDVELGLGLGTGADSVCRNGRALQPGGRNRESTITDPSATFSNRCSRCMLRVTSGWVENSILRGPEFIVLKARTLTIDESQNRSDINSLEN